MRAVVHTNLIVSGLLVERGAPSRLANAISRQRFTLVITDPLYHEYARVLPRPKFKARYGLTDERASAFLSMLLGVAEKVTPQPTLPLPVRDVNDEMVLAAALGGHADYLVTGDRDLLELRGRPELGALQIVTVVEFLEILGQ